MELLSSTLGDSISYFIYNGYSNNCLAGADLSPLIYLYYLNQSDKTSTLEILDEHSSNVLKKISRISFFPSSLSKQGPVLVAAEIKDNEILLKGIRDSTLFRTTTLNGSALFHDTGRANLSVISDSGSIAWVAWQGIIGGQPNIFIARTLMSTEVDNSLTLINSKSTLRTLKFEMAQNYPNPFNPTTIINYSVSKRCLVMIKVYDVLGKEVKTLVNEERRSGNYSVEFDGSKLSSGVYFYRMQAGDFIETKKLILLK